MEAAIRLQYRSSLNVAAVSNTVPIHDERCRRVMNFLSCLHCDSYFVKSIVLNGISAARGGNSPIGRNVALCSAHVNLNTGCIGISKLSSSECVEIWPTFFAYIC